MNPIGLYLLQQALGLLLLHQTAQALWPGHLHSEPMRE